MKRIATFVLLVCVMLSAFGCEQKDTANPSNSTPMSNAEVVIAENSDGFIEASFFAMDTYMEIKAFDSGEYNLHDIVEMIQELGKQLSVTGAQSDVAVINKSGSGDIENDVLELLETALEMCKDTDGALDITIYPIVKTWGFTTGEYKVPDDAEISELLKYVDYEAVLLDGNRVTIPENVQIDFGAFAKGYAADKTAELLRESGVKSAFANLGGNIYAVGTKPNGEKWNVGVKSPFDGEVLGVVACEDKAVVTSGGYERYFEENGETYWHIIDPDTGKPAKNGLLSVSVIGENATKCDALSTALFIMGLEEAGEYLKSHGDFDAVFVLDNGDVYITQGLEKDFSLYGKYTGARVEVLQ